ncbi:hypothetical protein NHF40_01650 [Maricaulaceae bacterium EIL42A08]|nr:hypothetical protein [Maricaulaceae bacterium EIL42A08]
MPDQLGQDFNPDSFDRNDPDPWLALWLDTSLPIDDDAKAALLKGHDSYSRRFLLPFLRPFVFVFFVLVHALRRIFLRWPNMPKTLHKTIHWGLRTFATPEANTLILRHFSIGTEILGFIKANAGPVEIESFPLKPTTLKELEDNIFLQHDLNIYNFIIELNKSLREQGRDLSPPDTLDLSMITDEQFEFEDFPDTKLNFVDIQTAIELYTPLYALFLPKNDFVRAANSLQLDETIAIYIAKILGTDYHLSFIKNGHPMVPLSTFEAGHRLMLHGLDAEGIHGWLRVLKRRQAAGLPLDPARPPGQIGD